ncbi:hypothetical protein [Rhizobium sp. FKY42]|uniref:hypothetical protein n=1 Tax=Rhizobium sp. FKY42 TaxID=2562310 RepID=UPI0010C14E4A|nr:hypothetical protein [Rhizobium sp. FKY42]
MEKLFGEKFTVLVKGKCDREMKDIISRIDRNHMPLDEISKIFVDGNVDSTIFPISISEEYYLMGIIKSKFGGPQYSKYTISGGSDGIYVALLNEKLQSQVDGIKFDECGNLLGDDYYTRVRHQEFLKNR